MGYYDCPYCKEKAASFMIFCGPFIFSKEYRKCSKCSNNLKLNVSSFLSFYMSIIAFFAVFGFLFPLGITRFYKTPGLVLFWLVAVFLSGIQFFIPGILHYFFGIKLFDRKNDEKESL
jgi:hypothetical protein